MQGNTLSGSIPTEMANLRNLRKSYFICVDFQPKLFSSLEVSPFALEIAAVAGETRTPIFG